MIGDLGEDGLVDLVGLAARERQERDALEPGGPERPVDQTQLYDNTFDPLQRVNLAGDEAYAPIVSDVRSRLHEWMAQTSDPLLRGPVPLPPGASANDPAARSFAEDLLVAGPDGELARVPNPRIDA